MKKLTAIAIAMLACGVMADEVTSTNAANTAKRKRTPEELEERARTSEMRRHGGTIRKPGSAYGKVVFLNAQKKVKSADLKGALDEIENTVHPIWEIKDVESVSLPNPAGDFKSHKGDVGVAIVDSDSLPALLLAPEEGWAVVNVAALSKGNPPADVLASRVRKELLRGFALAGGCAFMSRSQIVLRGDIRSPRDLDSIQEDSYGVEALMTLERMLPYYGVMPWKQATYKKACREGWAPAPTNEYQKAIWDKVHEPPATPMKIEFDPKKGR
jgi:hypothetical protein